MRDFKVWMLVGAVFFSGLGLVATASSLDEGLDAGEQTRRCADAAPRGVACEAVEFAPLVFAPPSKG